MGNWGEDLDYEAQAIEDHKGRFTINFKKIYFDVDEISEKTLEVTEKHPKDSLMKLWGGTMIGLFIFFLFTHQILALVTVPFIAFYLLALVRIGKCWKNFKYNAGQFWGVSIPTIAVLFIVAQLLQQVFMKLVF